ncbi:hypothetical protein BJY52DRAFT_1418319 [Lactarius psammicola]|nr:hypothetical protein BJY52DRAFT_1418319 [Lactarius psammicola]
MDDLHYWFEPVYQCAITISIGLKGMGFVLKQFEDSIGGVTASESVGERILDEVYANLAGVVIECIDDESKIRRGYGCQCRRHYSIDESVVTDGEIDWGDRSTTRQRSALTSLSQERPVIWVSYALLRCCGAGASTFDEPTRKVHEKPAPYNCKKRPPAPNKDTPKTSARPITTHHWQNLTLSDWFIVFQFIDDHPNILQSQVVEHFKTRREGALVFTQSTLSRKLEQRAELEARREANPIALSSKRPWVVTRPDIEQALVLRFLTLRRTAKGTSHHFP